MNFGHDFFFHNFLFLYINDDINNYLYDQNLFNQIILKQTMLVLSYKTIVIRMCELNIF